MLYIEPRARPVRCHRRERRAQKKLSRLHILFLTATKEGYGACCLQSHKLDYPIWGFCLQSLESDIHGSRECRFPELLTSAALLRVACREQSVEKRDAVLMSISNGR